MCYEYVSRVIYGAVYNKMNSLNEYYISSLGDLILLNSHVAKHSYLICSIYHQISYCSNRTIGDSVWIEIFESVQFISVRFNIKKVVYEEGRCNNEVDKKEREDRKAVWSSWKLENVPHKGLSIRN